MSAPDRVAPPLPPPCASDGPLPAGAAGVIERSRRRIDDIDSRILGLLEERMRVAREVGLAKRSAEMPLVASVREVQVLERAAARAAGALAPNDARAIFRAILLASRRVQSAGA